MGTSHPLGTRQGSLELRATALKAMEIFSDDLVLGEVPHDHVLAVSQSKLWRTSNMAFGDRNGMHAALCEARGAHLSGGRAYTMIRRRARNPT